MRSVSAFVKPADGRNDHDDGERDRGVFASCQRAQGGGGDRQPEHDAPCHRRAHDPECVRTDRSHAVAIDALGGPQRADRVVAVGGGERAVDDQAGGRARGREADRGQRTAPAPGEDGGPRPDREQRPREEGGGAERHGAGRPDGAPLRREQRGRGQAAGGEDGVEGRHPEEQHRRRARGEDGSDAGVAVSAQRAAERVSQGRGQRGAADAQRGSAGDGREAEGMQHEQRRRRVAGDVDRQRRDELGEAVEVEARAVGQRRQPGEVLIARFERAAGT